LDCFLLYLLTHGYFSLSSINGHHLLLGSTVADCYEICNLFLFCSFFSLGIYLAHIFQGVTAK